MHIKIIYIISSGCRCCLSWCMGQEKLLAEFGVVFYGHSCLNIVFNGTSTFIQNTLLLLLHKDWKDMLVSWTAVSSKGASELTNSSRWSVTEASSDETVVKLTNISFQSLYSSSICGAVLTTAIKCSYVTIITIFFSILRL